MTGFHPEEARCFTFAGYVFDPESAELRLHYRLDEREFCERVVFPGAVAVGDGPPRAALERCFHLTHLMAGISYFKAALPPRLEIATRPPGPRVARLLEKAYLNGLGEFAYRNDLSLAGRARFPSRPVAAPARPRWSRGNVVPLGGGKDSLVSCEALRRVGIEFRTIAVGQAPLLSQVAARVGRTHLAIERHLDPALMALNADGAYNGHVPISAILACIMLCGALLYGYDTVVMSNERSAEEGNLTLGDGFVVNHQYSKTLAFERAFGEAVAAEVLPGFRYFSLLRPFSELAVTRRFAELHRYHAVFSSCNGNFRLQGAAPARWCGDCPKCRFVYLALAPFLSPPRLLEIFARDLLAAPAQLDGFRALLGLDGAKPFECVGEIGECRAALRALTGDRQWREAPLVRQLSAELDGVMPEAPLASWLRPGGEHRVPEDFSGALALLEGDGDGFGES